MNEKVAMVFNIPGADRAIASSIEATLWQWAYTLERRRSEHAEPIARAARDVHASPMEHATHARSVASIEAALGESPEQSNSGLTRRQWLQIRHGVLPWLRALARMEAANALRKEMDGDGY